MVTELTSVPRRWRRRRRIFFNWRRRCRNMQWTCRTQVWIGGKYDPRWMTVNSSCRVLSKRDIYAFTTAWEQAVPVSLTLHPTLFLSWRKSQQQTQSHIVETGDSGHCVPTTSAPVRVFSHGWIPVNTGRSSLRDWLIALFWSIDTRNVSLLHGTYFYRCFSGVDYWSRRLSVRIRHADVLYKNGSRSKSMDIMPKRYAYAPITCGACSKMSEGSHVLLAFTSPNAADILLTPSSQKKSIGAPPPPPTPPPIK